MHGEYQTVIQLRKGKLGSPPHAWGIPPFERTKHGRSRITPTCMGNTARIFLRDMSSQDHPHMHGEYCFEQG